MTKTKNFYYFPKFQSRVVVVDGAHFRPSSPRQNLKQATGTKVMWGLKLLYLGNK
jgi:hypothetical protein